MGHILNKGYFSEYQNLILEDFLLVWFFYMLK